MTGASTSLDQIGFTELLKSGKHHWKNIKDEVMSEKDPGKQREIRVKATGAEYFVGSVQAVAETGEVVVASASGSQIPAYAFNARNVIWVVRMKGLGYPGSMIGKMLILERERVPGRNLTMVLVNEKLGF